MGERRRPALLDVPAARTNVFKFTPISRAARIINVVNVSEDLFGQNLQSFVRRAQIIIEVGLFKIYFR